MRCVKNKVSRAASHVNGDAHPVRRTSRNSPCGRPAVEPLPAPCALPGGLIYTDAAAYGAPQPAARPADRPRPPKTAQALHGGPRSQSRTRLRRALRGRCGWRPSVISLLMTWAGQPTEPNGRRRSRRRTPKGKSGRWRWSWRHPWRRSQRTRLDVTFWKGRRKISAATAESRDVMPGGLSHGKPVRAAGARWGLRPVPKAEGNGGALGASRSSLRGSRDVPAVVWQGKRAR